jgi:hypothetical protein
VASDEQSVLAVGLICKGQEVKKLKKPGWLSQNKTRQEMDVSGNIEVRSRNPCCSGKADFRKILKYHIS